MVWSLRTDLVYRLQVLSVLHDESLSSKVKSQQKKLQAALQQLLRNIQDPCCPSYTAAALLRALSLVNGKVRGHWLPVGRTGATVAWAIVLLFAACFIFNFNLCGKLSVKL